MKIPSALRNEMMMKFFLTVFFCVCVCGNFNPSVRSRDFHVAKNNERENKAFFNIIILLHKDSVFFAKWNCSYTSLVLSKLNVCVCVIEYGNLLWNFFDKHFFLHRYSITLFTFSSFFILQFYVLSSHPAILS